MRGRVLLESAQPNWDDRPHLPAEWRFVGQETTVARDGRDEGPRGGVTSSIDWIRGRNLLVVGFCRHGQMRGVALCSIKRDGSQHSATKRLSRRAAADPAGSACPS